MLRHQDGSGEAVGGGILLELAPQRGKGAGFAHARQRYIGRTRNRSSLELQDSVRVGGLNVDRDSSELIGVALFHDRRESRGRGGIRFHEVEAARAIPERHFLVDVGFPRGKIQIEELRECGAIAAIEGIEPRRELMRGRCIRQLGGGVGWVGREQRGREPSYTESSGLHNTMRQAGFEPTTFGSGGGTGQRPPTLAVVVSGTYASRASASASQRRPHRYRRCYGGSLPPRSLSSDSLDVHPGVDDGTPLVRAALRRMQRA